MKQGFRIALSLLRIRRLFFTLILFPLVLSLLVVTSQSLLSSAAIQALEKKEGKPGQSLESQGDLLKSMLFGSDTPPALPLICRWTRNSEKALELPPSDDCFPDRLDAAVIVSNPESFDPSEYRTLLAGYTERIHLCTNCAPDLRFFPQQSPRKLEIHSVWAALILHMTSKNDSVLNAYKSVRESSDQLLNIIGTRYFISSGFRRPINLSDIRSPLLFIFNVAALIVVALWLALKAHRRILDYFAQNGALLPMVAANGKENFYLALWLITLTRVGAFLLSAVPLTLFAIHEYILNETTLSILSANPLITISWGFALTASLTLATLIASIADLRHRTNLLSVAYRILPLFMAFAGALAWSATFLFDFSAAPLLRSIICAIPIVGMTPIFLGLIFQCHQFVFIIHTIGSFFIIIILARLNANWFGAHLEEI